MNPQMDLSRVTAIVPSLDPDARLAGVVESLQKEGFSDILLVDDGSKPENKAFFPSGKGITLLTHEINRGKGAALKTALRYILENRPDTAGALTCDGDGQHLASDARLVCEEMLKTGAYTLGVRDFSLPEVPPKSRVGNRVSAAALALVSGVKLRDTQTGLRAVPKALLQPMSRVSGDRFEYETNVLLELKNMSAAYTQVTIQTVYLDSNKGTHYRPFADSVRIASLLLKYIGSSLAAFAADILLFSLLNHLLSLGILASTVLARAFSSLLNFFLNRQVVFNSHASVGKSILKYYALAVPVMLVSAFGITGLCTLFRLDPDSLLVTLIKILVDTVLFLINFRLQKYWIFRKKNGFSRKDKAHGSK